MLADQGFDRSIVALDQRLVNIVVLWHKVISSALTCLATIICPTNHVDAVIERVLHHAYWLSSLHLRSLIIVRSSVWEECLINLE